MSRIAKVVVDLALDREFDYRVPPRLEDQLAIGSRVVAPFGKRKVYGYIVGFADASSHSNLKEILDRVGRAPLLTEKVLELARWIADYYVTPFEAVVRTILPSAVRQKRSGFKERLRVHPREGPSDPDTIQALERRAPRQAAVLAHLLTHGPAYMKDLVERLKTTPATVRELEKKGWVSIESAVIRRDPFMNREVLPTEPHTLMPQQEEALKKIRCSIDRPDPSAVLLHGVTGSGKTEVYMQALQYAMDRGRGGIILVPEIALTPQTVERFRSRFGDQIAVLHSHLSTGERHDEWYRVRDGEARIAIGARSALFAPVRNLGLIVVDEEHENTYKQEEAPRYHARDVAVVRGRLEGCSVILGSATPSIESYHNALNGKYDLVRLPHRVDHRKMPVLRVVDMREEVEREGRVNVLSRDLKQAIESRLERAEQTILFLNRRGFATSLICPKCGYVAECGQCSVAMTYHKRTDELRCHICDARRRVPRRCPNPECQDPAFRFSGIGTQRVEEVVARLFPGARVQRMDSDTTVRKESYDEILGQFRAGKIDVLVGTQMIAKGLHYPNVTLVGVINADTILHMADFRAGERTFQLLTQVAGRAGRGDVMGEVIVQTFTPYHPAVQAARRMDYEGFCDQEIEFRRELSYPPYTHLICITLRGPSENHLVYAGSLFARKLKPKLPEQAIMAGPAPAPLARIKGLYRYQVMIRSPAIRPVSTAIRELLKDFKWPDKVQYAMDVDAWSIL